MTAIGTHSDMDRAEYDALPHLNYSLAKELHRSPKHFQHRKRFPREDSPALKVGRMCHLAILEQERFREEVIQWDGDRRAGKAWEAFKADHAGKEIVLPDEYRRACMMREAVLEHREARALIEGGRSEVTAIAELMDVEVKARFDYLAGKLVELKTTRHAERGAFERDCARLLYHAQLAWYGDVLAAATGERLPVRVIALESEAPFCVTVFEVDESVLAPGRALYQGWLRTYLSCREADRWPGPTEGILRLELLAWAPGIEEEAEDAAA